MQDRSDGPLAIPLKKNTNETRDSVHGQHERTRTNTGTQQKQRMQCHGYSLGVQEGEAARAARGSEAGIDGGVVAQVPVPQLLLVHLSRPHLSLPGLSLSLSLQQHDHLRLQRNSPLVLLPLLLSGSLLAKSARKKNPLPKT